MGDLILHIGTTKTGTTSLQKFLAMNRKQLTTHGIALPKFTKQAGASLIRNGIFLNQYCLGLARQNESGAKAENPPEDLKRLSDYLRDGARILLSDETVYANSNTYGVLGTYWPTMARILADAGANEVTAIIYLRRQDDWIASAWRQVIKTGHETQGLASYYSGPWARRLMSYASTIEAVEGAFEGRARIVVRRYERGSFSGGDIYHDFCDAAGIPWDTGYAIPKAEKNASLTFDVAEALRTFASAAPKNSTLRTDILIPLAYELSAQHPDPRGTTPFDEETTRALMEPFLEGNRQISERYLDGGPLFSEEYGGHPVWAPDEERIAKCRTAFEEALETYKPPSTAQSLSRGLLGGVKQSLKAVRERLLSR